MIDTKRPPDPEEPAKCEEPETERGGSPATHSSSRINEEEVAGEGHKPPDASKSPGVNAPRSP
jgi:hypothetical protein